MHKNDSKIWRRQGCQTARGARVVLLDSQPGRPECPALALAQLQRPPGGPVRVEVGLVEVAGLEGDHGGREDEEDRVRHLH